MQKKHARSPRYQTFCQRFLQGPKGWGNPTVDYRNVPVYLGSCNSFCIEVLSEIFLVLPRRKPFAQRAKNTEEQELEKVQQLQQELAEALKKNEESLKSALAGGNFFFLRWLIEM